MTDDETLLEALHRKERYRLMREKEEQNLAAVIGTDSAWAQFVKVEEERSKKLEPLRRAYLEAHKKKVNQEKEEMNIDGQEVIVISREKILAIYQAMQANGAKRFYLSEDQRGNIRFGALVEVPAHYKRKAISLTDVKP